MSEAVPPLCLHIVDRNNVTLPLLHVIGRKDRRFDASRHIFINCVSEFIQIYISRFFLED
jgi:hypothetical protein